MAARKTEWNRLLVVVLVGVIVSVCTARKADVTIVLQVGESVTLVSPNYPSNYNNNADILASVEAPAEHTLGLVFTEFDLQNGFDYLTIFEQKEDTDFNEHNADEIARLTGSDLPNPITSGGRRMWIRFTTDNTITGSGLSIHVFVLSADGDTTIVLQVGENKTITSPNYPDMYDNNNDILWRITAPAGHTLGVVFISFDLEDGHDDLTIYEQIESSNVDENTTRQIIQLTGSDLPNLVTSVGRRMWIRFSTDFSITKPGFSLKVFALSDDGVWNCDFEIDECDVTHGQGTWSVEDNTYDSKYYEADLGGMVGTVASFTLPTQSTSKTGFISFRYYSWTNIMDSDQAQGSLSVDICGSNIFLVHYTGALFHDTGPMLFTCLDVDDVEITFTATRGSRPTTIAVDDILVISIPGLPEETTIVTSMSQTAEAATTVRSSKVTTKGRSNSLAMTGSDSATMTMSTIMTSESTKGSTTSLYVNDASVTGNRGAVVVPVVASLLSVIIIAVLVLVLLFLVRKRRRNAAPPLDPSKTEEDDPTLFDNPAYCSKDILDTPDIIMGVHVPPSTSPAGAAVLPSNMGGQTRLAQDVSSSECETALDTEANHAYYSLEDPQTEYNYIGITSPRTEDDGHIYQDASAADSMATTKPSANPERSGPVNSAGSANPYQELRRPHAANDGENNPAYHTLENPSVGSHESCKPSVNLELTPAGGNATLYDEEEYNTLNKSPLGGKTWQVPPQNPKKVPGSSTVDGIEGGYSALARLENDSTMAERPGDILSDNQYNTLGESESVPEEKKEPPNVYNELDLSSRNGDQDYASCDEPAGDITSGKLGQTNCSAGYDPLRIVDNTYQSVDEPEYHSYQDPTDMGKKGNTTTPADPQALYDSQYNVLHSGKEMGNYHLYQAAKDLPPTDDAVYEEFQSEKLSPVDEYSTINQDLKTRSNQVEPANQHQPIYSDEVYGEY